MTPPLSRRDFLAQTAVASAALAASSALASSAPRANLPKSATDKVALGKSGVTVSVVGMGTGTVGYDSSSNQTRQGIKGFTEVVRHAIDRGVAFFDVADQYGSHTYLREALKGVPRDQYVIQTKTHAREDRIAKNHIERFCMELGVDYIDILLLHCMTNKTWTTEYAGAMDHLRQAKEKGQIRAHGVSCHGMDPLRIAARTDFVEVDLARINPEGLVMDDRSPDEVASELQELHDRGAGVVGMKILGEGRIKTPEGIDASLRYVLGLGTVNAFVVGFETPDQIDDLLKRTNDAIAFNAEKHKS